MGVCCCGGKRRRRGDNGEQKTDAEEEGMKAEKVVRRDTTGWGKGNARKRCGTRVERKAEEMAGIKRRWENRRRIIF